MDQGFYDTRSEMYRYGMENYSKARRMDLELAVPLLELKERDQVLEIGGGSDHFRKAILESIGDNGGLVVTDPSSEQIRNTKNKGNIEYLVCSAENLEYIEDFDKIFSFGAFHHVSDQTEAMKRIYKALKPEGKVVICDVFQGSNLARHFDIQVARYCINGHEVKFLSNEFARSLCYLAGFKDKNVEIVDLPIQWEFDSEYNLGEFIYNIHAMTNLKGTRREKIEQVYNGCEEILGVEYQNGKLLLNWPMKALVVKK